jgi:hypothetical protein
VYTDTPMDDVTLQAVERIITVLKERLGS